MKKDDERLIKILIGIGIIISLFVLLHSKSETPPMQKLEHNILQAFNSSIIVREYTMGSIMFDLSEPKEEGTTIYAWITGYNSVREQTDDTPCLASNGNICGRKQVVACPRSIPLGTWIKIDGKAYECMDRLATKYDDRFDLFFDKDIQGAINYGKQYKEIIILK
jgi:hypothetical protein